MRSYTITSGIVWFISTWQC